MLDLIQEIVNLPHLGRRELFGYNLISHTSYYNSQIHRTIEQNRLLDGKSIVRNSSETVFYNMFQCAGKIGTPITPKQAFRLFSDLGYGHLEDINENERLIKATSSHFAEGWKKSQLTSNHCVCAFVEGCLQAVLRLFYGTGVAVRETKCLARSDQFCEFHFAVDEHELHNNPFRSDKIKSIESSVIMDDVFSKNLNRNEIISKVFELPFASNSNGLITVFNTLLTHIPADYYLLITKNYLEEMKKCGLYDTALFLLAENTECSALSTFHSFMNSVEWDTIIHPMIKASEDNIFALIALISALGWGTIHVHEHIPNKTLTLKTANGYESNGYKNSHELSIKAQCHMLTATISGLMGLMYGHGELDDRLGLYKSHENMCVCRGDKYCLVECTSRSTFEH